MEDNIAAIGIFIVSPLIGLFWWMLSSRRKLEERRLSMQMGGQLPQAAVTDGKTLIELEKLRLADREKARALFERLSLEKLDVLKTSIQSGYKEEELARLDERLERIIGSTKLQQLLDESTASGAAQPVPATAAARTAAAGQGTLPSAELSGTTEPAAAGPERALHG